MLLNLQMLRALAAFLVVMVHLEPLAVMGGLAPRSLHFGVAGVDLFFVISGLIMVVTTADGRQSPLSFLRNRITRVVPLYWGVTFLVFGLAVLAPWAFQETTSEPAYLLKSLAFIPYVRPDGHVYPLLFVGWSLNYEMAFYLLFALGMAAPWRRAGLALTGALLIAAVLAGALSRPSDPVLRFYSDPMLLEFVGGIGLGVLLPRLKALAAPRWAAAAFMGFGLAAMIAGGAFWPHARDWIVPISAILVVAAAVVAEAQGLRFDGRWTQRLGAASYAIYLTHVFCTQAVVMATAGRDLAPLACAALFVAALALTAAVGLAVHHVFERPLTRLVRGAFAPRAGQVIAAAALPAPPSRTLGRTS